MGNSPQNINISGTDFPAKLAQRRIGKNLSKTALAEAAGLTYRTIHDLESGRRDRIQEKTLMLLATALDVSLDDLLNGGAPDTPDIPDAPTIPAPAESPPTPKSKPWYRSGALVSALLVVIITSAAGFAVYRYSVTHAQFVSHEYSIQTSYGLFGGQMWSAEFPAKITTCKLAPWDEQQILVGLHHRSFENEKLYCFERSTGKLLWKKGPDTAELVDAFGSQAIQPGGFSCARSCQFFWDGDDIPELLVQFDHQNQCPTVFWVIDQHGSILGQYAHWGPIIEWVVSDIDGLPGEELVAVGRFDGTEPAEGSVIYLDKDHFSGASVDAQNFPRSSVADLSLARTLIPPFPEPYHQRLNTDGVCVYSVRVLESPQGLPLIKIDCGYSKYFCLMIIFDAELNILESHDADQFHMHIVEVASDLLDSGPGPFDPVWRQQWLRGCQKFGSLSPAEGGTP